MTQQEIKRWLLTTRFGVATKTINSSVEKLFSNDIDSMAESYYKELQNYIKEYPEENPIDIMTDWLIVDIHDKVKSKINSGKINLEVDVKYVY